MGKNIFLLLLIVYPGCGHLQAQVTDKTFTDLPVKFGKIELSDFETRPEGKDSSASAIKLLDKGTLKFDISNRTGAFKYVFTRHTRILILKKDAYDLANIEIGLYKSDKKNEEVLSSFDASTYNHENGTITTYKIGKDAKFSDRYDKNTTIRKFALSNIKEGSIIEYKYEIHSDFLFNLRDWSFQSSIPTVLSDFSITIPEYFNYKKYLKGYVSVFAADTKPVNQTFYANLSGDPHSTSRTTVACKSTLHRYVAKNVPSLREEAFITTLDDYKSKIEFEISSTQFPNSPYTSYTETWDKIILNLHNHENFGGLLKSNYGKNLTATIVRNESNALKKLELVFSFVKKNVKYNGDESKYSDQTSLRSIIEKKAGNVADINLLLINMLDHAGLNAYPILLSTRSNGLHPGYPLIGKFNYVVAGVTIDSTNYFLDATSLTNGLNMVSFDCLNHKGLALNMSDKKAEWVPLELKSPSQNHLTYVLKLSAENVFTGLVYERKTEFNGWATRQKYINSQNEEDYLKNYRSSRNGLKINNFEIKDLDSLSLPVVLHYNATIEDMVEEAGNLIYFTPLLYERTKDNPFKLEEREFPVDFGYAHEEIYRITIELPDNLTVDKLPKSEMFKLADNSAYFSYLTHTDGKMISVVSKISVGRSFYDPATYFELKELFMKIVSKQAEQIVLKKI